MILELDPAWRGHDDYAAALAGKYRKAAKKIFADIERAGIRVEILDDLRGARRELHELYLNLNRKAKIRPATFTEDFLPALALRLKNDARCIVARKGDTIVGFVTLVRDGETAVGYFIGYDMTENSAAPIYLRLMHAVIAEAIALGCRRVSYGRTALEPKARLGCAPHPLRIWVRHRVPVLNLALRTVLGLVPADEAPDRSPFKSERSEEGGS